MSACAHLAKPFAHLSRDKSIEVEKAMIGLINEHALLGVAVAVNEVEYETWFAGLAVTGGSAYTFCCLADIGRYSRLDGPQSIPWWRWLFL